MTKGKVIRKTVAESLLPQLAGLLEELPYLKKLRVNMDLKGCIKVLELGVSSPVSARKAREEGRKIIYTAMTVGGEIPIALSSPAFYVLYLEWQANLYWGVLKGERDFYSQSERYGVAREMCAWTKANMGSVINALWGQPDLLVAGCGSSCDDASKVCEILEWMGHKTYYAEVPYRRNPLFNDVNIGQDSAGLMLYTPEILEFQVQEYRRFKALLEEESGIKITDDMLRQTIRYYNRARKAISEIIEMRKARPTPLGAVETFLIQGCCNYLMGDPAGFCEAVETLRDEVAEIVERGEGVIDEDAVRITFCGNPYLDFQIFNQIEDAGATILGWEGGPVLLTPIDEEKDPLLALAENFLGDYPPFGDTEGMIRHIISKSKEFDCEGAIWNVQLGCSHSPVEGSIIQKEVEKALGIPVLLTFTDLPGDHPSGQVTTRIEAFVEMVKNRRMS